MAVAIAALRASGETKIDDAECVSVSYPGFFEVLRGLQTD
jgi:3-phosphoshikimate 1-carboxyvinyltransferase